MLGGGPNGLTAAAILAGAGLSVVLLEAQAEVGGAVRTAEVTAPGFRHDLLSGFYPLARVGPISRLPLARYGLEWCGSARPYGGGTPVGGGFATERTAADTEEALASHSPGDLAGWSWLWSLWRRCRSALFESLFHPIGIRGSLSAALRLPSPRLALELARMGLAPSARVAEECFSSEDARVWFIGGALHSDLTPQMAGGALYSFVLLGLAQEVGMPLPRGGASSLAGALRACIEDRGGRVLTDQPVQRLVVREGRIMGVETPSGLVAARRAVLATIEPQQLFLRLMDEGALPSGFVRAVRRFHWGSGVFKLDCALSGLPTFASERLNGVSVLHLGRSTSELTLAAAATEAGLLPAHPPLIVGIHTLADPTRAPQGAHTLWIETHVPARIRADAAGSIVARDWALAREAFAERLLDELEAYAPGLRSLLLGTRALSPDDLQALDANLVGGDNAGGTFGLHQQAVLRPVPGWFQHRTPIHGLYLGGASTHPGGGVHGAPGSNAARVLLADLGRARRYQQAFRA